MTDENSNSLLRERFRGYYPVVVDVETSGFDANTNAILEIAAVTLRMSDNGWLMIDKTLHFNIEPFPGSVLDAEALAFTGIDPADPSRNNVSEYNALHEIFKMVRKGVKDDKCNRAIMVAHNAFFDHRFMMAAAERCKLKRNPFHPFTVFDTASLSGLALGQTVLAKACRLAQLEFDHHQAHSALYDTIKTAELFCYIVNKWKTLGGWPLTDVPTDEQENSELESNKNEENKS